MAVPIEIDVWQGGVADLEVDAIVVPANESLFMTGAGGAVKRPPATRSSSTPCARARSGRDRRS